MKVAPFAGMGSQLAQPSLRCNAHYAGAPNIKMPDRDNVDGQLSNTCMLQICHGSSRAQILIPLYFVRYLTFNSFSVLRRTERLGKSPSPRAELPSNALGGVRLRYAVELDKITGKTQWLTSLP